MAFLFPMTGTKINKIQHFVIISVTFHLVLFLLWSTIAYTKNDAQNIEVFIISPVSKTENPITHQKKVNKFSNENTQQAKPPEMRIIDDEDIKKDYTSLTPLKSEATEISIETTNVAKGSSPSRGKASNDEGGEKIIDAPFGSANGPRFLHRETPVYPQIARRLGKEGKVVLRLTIDERGELLNIEILEAAPYGFTESAIEAVKKSKFSPAIKDGRPVASRAILPIRFILKN